MAYTGTLTYRSRYSYRKGIKNPELVVTNVWDDTHFDLDVKTETLAELEQHARWFDGMFGGYSAADQPIIFKAYQDGKLVQRSTFSH